MRRLCFDTESNYVKSATSPVGDLDYHREWINNFTRTRKIRWDCAVVYDEAEQEYREFGSQQTDELVIFLATADELISHSGQRHDLLILENILGVERVRPLLQVRHHDLFDICHWNNLEELTRRYVPERVLELKRNDAARLSDIDARFPLTRWGSTDRWRSDENFLEGKFAKARFDVECTYAVWDALRTPENGRSNCS